MGLVLGIDAAWTVTNPSGVALVSTETSTPRVIRFAPSFEDFVLGTSPRDWGRDTESSAGLKDVLETAAAMAGAPVDVIAVDMPIARAPVRGRRKCDHLISQTFGGRGCATHKPTQQRPGEVSDRFLKDAEKEGFALVTTHLQKPPRALLEVYPHVAALKLCNADYRIPYKLARRQRYWRSKNAAERLKEIRLSWDIILHFLNERLEFDLAIDCEGQSLQSWKAWEDVIDAVVCCWVGIEWLAGEAQPYGDESSAIWVPVGS